MGASITVKQGKTLRRIWTLAEDDAGTRPVALTGLQARMVVRGTVKLLGLSSVDLVTAKQSLKVQPAGVVGEVHLYLGATVTELLPEGQHSYEIELYDPNNADEVSELDGGLFVVLGEVKP